MPKARHQRVSLYQADIELYLQTLAETNERKLEELRQNLTLALRDEISPRQREMLYWYYGKKLSMTEISALLHCHPSTVSRTLRRGEMNLYRILKYCI